MPGKNGGPSTPDRWLTPDPSGKKAVSLTDPQTWNMYAYVNNNPLALTDPLGLLERSCSSDPSCEGPGSGLGDLAGGYGGSSSFYDLEILGRGPHWPAYGIHVTVTAASPAAGQPGLAGSSWAQRLGCAAQYGDQHSLASFLGVNHNILGDALFGNTISDVANAFLFVANGSGSPAQTGASFALNGPTLGIPTGIRTPGLTSGTDTAIEAGVGSFLNGVRGVGTEPIELGLGSAGKIATEILPVATELVGQIAGYIAIAKVGLDLGIDAYAYIGPRSQ